MFDNTKKKPDASQAVHSLLGKGTIWKGEVHCGQHSMRVEGTVEGTIHSEGEVIVAPTGLVIGKVLAKHMVVTGRVEGVFKIAECLEIHGTGTVEGDVEVGSLVVDEGGTLQGTCVRKGYKGKKEVVPVDKPDRDRNLADAPLFKNAPEANAEPAGPSKPDRAGKH